MAKPYAVVFAGVPGSSKSIIAHYLSCEFNLPIFNNDVIRAEVKEDLLVDNINIPRALAEFEKRFNIRRQQVLKHKRPVILDGSVDRQWGTVTRQQLIDYGYDWFLISLDWSFDFMKNLYDKTSRLKAIEQLPVYQKQHDDFLATYSKDVLLHLKDEDFHQRNMISATALKVFLEPRQ